MSKYLLVLFALLAISCHPKDTTPEVKQDVADVHQHAVEAQKHITIIVDGTAPASKLVDQIEAEHKVAEFWKTKYEGSYFGGKAKRWGIVLGIIAVVGIGARLVATGGSGWAFTIALWIGRTALAVVTGGISLIERLIDNLWHRKQAAVK